MEQALRESDGSADAVLRGNAHIEVDAVCFENAFNDTKSSVRGVAFSGEVCKVYMF